MNTGYELPEAVRFNPQYDRVQRFSGEEWYTVLAEHRHSYEVTDGYQVVTVSKQAVTELR